MAHVSPMKRKLRRLKRERSLAYRLADVLVRQRDQARAMANTLGHKLEVVSHPVEPSRIIQP